MAKPKLTYDYVKQFVESWGYVLLSETYIGSKEKLKFKCPKGHEFEKKWSNFQNGQRCPKCSIKWTHENIKNIVEENGYTLLSKDCNGSRSKIKVRCPKGHEYEARADSFIEGRRCLKCNVGGRLTYEYVKEQIEKEGYTLLSDEYVQSHEKLKVKCPVGHEYEVRWSNFHTGTRCPVCCKGGRPAGQEIADKKSNDDKMTIEEFIEYRISRDKSKATYNYLMNFLKTHERISPEDLDYYVDLVESHFV